MDEQTIKCAECGRDNLQPGQYVIYWYDDNDEEFILCNPCDQEHARETREAYAVSDIHYP